MELYMSGLEVPPLGSFKDKVFRQFQIRQANKEISKNKVMAYAAIAMANMSKSPKTTVESILGAWNDYANLELYLEGVKVEQDRDMLQEFEFWRKVKPEVNINQDGKLEVSVNSLKPKSKK